MEVVAAKTYPNRAAFKSLYSGAGVGISRDHQSYVVAVEAGKTKGSSVRFYWPRAWQLKGVS